MAENHLNTNFDLHFNSLNLKTVSVKKAKHLFNQGDAIDYIFYLKKGAFNIIKNNKLLWQAQANEFIGVSSFFSEEQFYSYTVRASINAEVVKIPVDVFKQAIEKSPELNAYLMKIFCERIKFTEHKNENISYLTKKKKIIKTLISNATKKSSIKATFGYGTSELSKMINMPLQIVTDTLSDLQQKHLLNVKNNEIEILDFQALKFTL